jgi:hypothetical protein
MYLGDEKVRTLATYIAGYVQAREDLGVPPYGDGEGELLSQFDDWLCERLKTDRISAAPGYAWPRYIEQADGSDKNVHTLIKLFEEFLAGKGKSFLDPYNAASGWPAQPWAVQRRGDGGRSDPDRG